MTQPTGDANSPATTHRRRAIDARYRQLSRRYGDALRTASTTAAEAMIDEALAAGASAPDGQTEVIGPAMGRIGDLGADLPEGLRDVGYPWRSAWRRW